MKKSVLVSLLLATAISSPALAHTLWVVPSHFVLSKAGSWVSADVSAANMTFVADKGVSGSMSLYTRLMVKSRPLSINIRANVNLWSMQS